MALPSKHIIGLTSVTFRNRSAEDILQLCRAIGIDDIEWGGDVHVPPGDLALAQDIQTLRELVKRTE